MGTRPVVVVGWLTVLSDKALRQISKGRRSHRAKGVRVSASREGF